MRQQTTAPGVVTNTKWTLSTNPPSRPILAADAGCPHHRLLLSMAQHHGAGREQRPGSRALSWFCVSAGECELGKAWKKQFVTGKNPQTKTKPSVKNKGCTLTDSSHLGANHLLLLKTCAVRIILSHNKAKQKSYSAIKMKATVCK